MDKKTVYIESDNFSATLHPDNIGWDYPQTDGEGSTATDENVLIREVLPERDKIFLSFSSGTSEEDLQRILKVRKLEECYVTFYDVREGERVTKKMHPVSDAIKAKYLINNEFVVEPFELRFIQMIPNQD